MIQYLQLLILHKAGFLIYGMNSPSPRSSSCIWSKLPCSDSLRHARLGGPDDRSPDLVFDDLPLEGSGVRTAALLLEPVHHGIGDAAAVVVAIVLPVVERCGFDNLEAGNRGGGRLPT